MILFQVLCIDKPEHAEPGELSAITRQLLQEAGSSPFDWVPMNTLDLMEQAIEAGRETSCGRELLARLYSRLAENPHYAARRVPLRSLLMRQYQLLGEQEKADMIAAELASQNNLQRVWTTLARHLHESGRPEDAMTIIDKAIETTSWSNPVSNASLRLRAYMMKKELAAESRKTRKNVEKT